MGDVHIFQDNTELSGLGLTGKELSTFVQLLARLVNTSKGASAPETAGESSAATSLTQVAEGLYRLRRRREALMTTRFGGDIFADPAGDIMLYLYIHSGRGEPVSVTRACSAANVPITTALRYVTVLADRGLIERSKNPEDGRSYLLKLSPAAIELMEETIGEMLPKQPANPILSDEPADAGMP